MKSSNFGISAAVGAFFFLATGATQAFAADVAKVNGHAITDQDVRSAVSGLNDTQRAEILRDPNSKRQILSNLIDQEVLVNEGEKEKLDQEADFKVALAAFKRQYLTTKVLEKNLSAKVTDATAKKYFNEHKSRFSTDEVHVQHILLNDETAARDMLKKAKEKDADFQALAEKFSKDPSAKNNRGDLGMITHDSPFVSEFKEAAFNAGEGQIIGPVKTLYGYHVIKVVEKKFGHPLNYDEVELKVKGELRQELVQNFVSKLKGQAKIQVDDKVLDKI